MLTPSRTNRQIAVVMYSLSLTLVAGCVVQSDDIDDDYQTKLSKHLIEGQLVDAEDEPDLLELAQQLRKANATERATTEYRQKLKKLEAAIQKLPKYGPPSEERPVYHPDDEGQTAQPQVLRPTSSQPIEPDEDPPRSYGRPYGVPQADPSLRRVATPEPDMPRVSRSIPHQDRNAELAKRIEDTQIAIHHLNAAGMRDLAEQAKRRSDELVQEMRRQNSDPRDESIEDLRREIRQLREELQLIRESFAARR